MPARILLLALVFGLSAQAAIAQPITAVDISDLPDGDYVLTKKAGVAPSVRPLRLTKPTVGLPSPPGPVPSPPSPLTPFEKEVQVQTAKVLASGGTKTTGAALSTVYSIVADKVSDGSIPVDQALPAIKAATNLVLNDAADKDAWGPWRTAVGDALTKLQQEGSLATKAQYVGAFRQVAVGLNGATGYVPAALANPPANGILAGIDIAKIIELIKLIMELLKLFGGG